MSPRVSVRWAAVWRIALASGFGALVVSLLATMLGLATLSVTTAVVLRTLFVTAVLVLLVPLAIRGDAVRPAGVERLGTVLVGGVLGYLVDLASWNGRAYAAQLVLDPGVLTFLLDLVLWLGVLWLGVRWRVPVTQAAPVEEPTGYVA